MPISVLVLACTCLPVSAMLQQYNRVLAKKIIDNTATKVRFNKLLQKRMVSTDNTQSQDSRLIIGIGAAMSSIMPGVPLGEMAGRKISTLVKGSNSDDYELAVFLTPMFLEDQSYPGWHLVNLEWELGLLRGLIWLIITI